MSLSSSQPTKASWLTAVAICAALAVMPLLAWLVIPERAPRRAPSPPLPAAAFTPRAAAPAAAATDEDGARLLFGTISDEDGEPVAGAEVFIAGEAKLRTLSGVDGAYRLHAVPLEELELVVRSRRHRAFRLDLDESEPGAQEQHDIRLAAAPSVEGVVLDPDGSPIARARVVCSDGDGVSPALTHADGRFVLSPMAAGCTAVASHRSYEDSEPALLQPGPDNQLQLSRGASISGTVISSSGGTVERFTVTVESFKPADGKSRAGRTGTREDVIDGSGRFSLQGLKPGAYVLSVNADGYPSKQSGNIEVAASERRTGIRIQLERGGSMSGVVSDADSGEPIAGASVGIDITTATGSKARTRSDENGRYQLQALPTEAFSLRVSAKGYNGRILSALRTEAGRESQCDITLSAQAEGERRTTNYTGIGAQLGMSPDGVIIGRVFKGGPALEAGLEIGDVIQLLDGADASTMTVGQAVEKIRGPAGTRIGLTVRRKTGERVSLVIERRDVTH